MFSGVMTQGLDELSQTQASFPRILLVIVLNLVRAVP